MHFSCKFLNSAPQNTCLHLVFIHLRNSFTLSLLACLMVTPCVPTILTPAVLTFLLLYNLWFEHHSTNSPINQVYTVTLVA